MNISCDMGMKSLLLNNLCKKFIYGYKLPRSLNLWNFEGGKSFL